jgi:preprotein translocase subunit SecG
MDAFLATVFVIICVLMIVVVLLQKGRGGGLGSAFGGSSGDVFTWVTISLSALYLLLAIVTVKAFRPEALQLGAPAFDVASGPIAKQTLVSIQAPAADEIYYTISTDGIPPDPSRRNAIKYDNTPLLVQPGTSLKAIAFARGYTESKVVAATYDRPTLAAPTFAPAGPIEKATPITIKAPNADPGEIYYTLGTAAAPPETPTQKTGKKYDGTPVTVTPGTIIKAVAFSAKFKDSPVGEMDYEKPGVTTATAPASAPAKPAVGAGK